MLSLVADARHVIGVDLAHDRFWEQWSTSAAGSSTRRNSRSRRATTAAAVAAVYALLDKLVRARHADHGHRDRHAG